MKFSTRKDIVAPAEFLFQKLADFGTFERLTVRRGGSLRRLDRLSQPGAGMSWDIGFRFRGRDRQMIVNLNRYEPDEILEYHGSSKSFEIGMQLQLTDLSKSRTRLNVGFEIKPRTLGARLMVQSAKLGKGNLDRRFVERIDQFAKLLEQQAEEGG